MVRVAITTTIKDLTIQFAHFFSNKDAYSIGTLLAENFSLYDPAMKWIHGKKEVIEILEKQFEETKNVIYEVINVYEDGNTSILEFKITLDDLILNGVDFMEWKEDLLVELRCYYNPPDL